MRWGSPVWLLAPGLLVILLGLGLPLLQTLTVSLWSSNGFVMDRTLTLKQYQSMIEDPTFWTVLFTTLKTAVVVVCGTLLIAYPVAYCIAFIVPESWRMVLLLLAIIPFWTSYLTRMVTYMPILGRTGVINQLWMSLGLPGPLDFLLYTEASQLAVMIALYALFGVGPVFFSLSRIDRSLLEASSTLGGGPLRTFWRVTLPLSMPGVITGAIFVTIFVMQEYATAATIGGAKTPVLGNDIVLRAGLVQWPAAAARSMVLALVTLGIVAALLRLADIRREL